MKKISIPISLFLALLPLSGKAQSLIPKLKGSESVTAETPKGATTTASYTIGSSPSKSTVIRPGNKAGGAAVRPAVSNKRVSVPRAEREIPDAKVSKAYTQEVRTNVHFRVNRTELDLAYLENGQTLTELFEMLDKDMRAIHVMRTFTNVMPGERRGCTGCHESQLNTQANVAADGAQVGRAVTRPAADLTPPSWGVEESISCKRFVPTTRRTRRSI